MNEFFATLILLLLFALRFVLPLGATMGVCWLMNHWIAANEPAM